MLVFNRKYFCGNTPGLPIMYGEGNGICRFLVNTCSVAPQWSSHTLHIKIFHSRSFKVRCFFKQSLIRSLLVSHQGWNIFFLFTGEHLLPEYRLAIHLKWEFSFFAMHCLPRSVPLPGTTPALKLLRKGLGFLTKTFCHGYCQHSLEGLQKGA